MAVMTSLPAARAAFIDQSGRPTPQFYRFLETLATAQAGNVSPDEITAINAQLSELQAEIAALPSAEIPKLQVTYPILSQGLLQNGFAKLALNQPGDSGAGALKGITLDAWGRVTGTTDGTITGTAGRVTVANGDATAGVPTIDLAPVANAGGGSLLKIVRDAWGRITGTSTPTTTDLAEGTNLYYTDSRADARITAQKGQPSGLATLDGGGKLDAGQLPALAITETFVVNTEAAMLALSAQEGDVAVRTDLSKSFILTADPPSTLSNWQELLTPMSPVTSVFGRTGPVAAASGDYTPAQVGAEPAITAGTTSQYWRGDKTWRTLDKAAVGLGNVDDTSSAGTYAPTLTDVTNTGSSSAFTCQWMRVGNTITVSGRLQTTAATGGAASQLDISLPVPSNFTDGGGLGGAGTAFSSAGNVPVVIFTETANDRARFLFTPITGSSQAIGFVFTYIVQ